jgi:hypothetical protein
MVHHKKKHRVRLGKCIDCRLLPIILFPNTSLKKCPCIALLYKQLESLLGRMPISIHLLATQKMGGVSALSVVMSSKKTGCSRTL